MTRRVREISTVALLAVIFFAGASFHVEAQSARAQRAAKSSEDGTTLPNAFQGFARDRKDPVKIESNTLEVYDREKYAVFIGNVFVQQGESTMRCSRLKVFYIGGVLANEKIRKSKDKGLAQAETPLPVAQIEQKSKADKSAPNNPGQRIRKLEASGGVIVTSKDQKATGDFGIFDMPTNTATLIGNVVVTQGPNVIRGEKLVVDLTTGLSRVEAGGKDGPARVQGVFVPNTLKNDKAKKSDQPLPLHPSQQQSQQ